MPEILHNNRSILYTLKRTPRRRSVALRVEPTGAVTVLAPRFALQTFIERFVRSRADWIVERLQDVEDFTRRYPSKTFVSGESFPLWGQEIYLEVIRCSRQPVPSCVFAEGRLQVYVSQDETTEETVTQAVRHAVQGWYSRQLEAELPDRLVRYTQRLGVLAGRVKIADQRRRWASCSRNGNLRFNWRLATMPPAILDYVVVHELAHILAHDHSRRFWSIVESILPDYKQRRTWLHHNRVPF